MEDKTFDKYEQRGAYHWDWYATNKHQYREKVDKIISYLPDSGTLIDIGGGDGLISYQAFLKGLDVTCIDSNKYSIQLAQEQFEQQIYGKNFRGWLNKTLSSMNLMKTPEMERYETGGVNLLSMSVFDMDIQQPFDFIICHEVIEHVPEPERLLKLIHENMTQFAIISTPDTTTHPPHELDYHSWTAKSFREFLADYRFEFIIKDGLDIYVKLYK